MCVALTRYDEGQSASQASAQQAQMPPVQNTDDVATDDMSYEDGEVQNEPLQPPAPRQLLDMYMHLANLVGCQACTSPDMFNYQRGARPTSHQVCRCMKEQSALKHRCQLIKLKRWCHQ